MFIVFIPAGGRVFEVIVYEWQRYSDHLNQIAHLWAGGMATHGIPAGSTPAPIVSAVILLLLILVPLSIPTSWTKEYLAIKRGTATDAVAP